MSSSSLPPPTTPLALKAKKQPREPKVVAKKVSAKKVAAAAKKVTAKKVSAKKGVAKKERHVFDTVTAAIEDVAPQPTDAERLALKRDIYRAKWLQTLHALRAHQNDDGDAAVVDLEKLAQHLERGAFNHAIIIARKRRLLIHPGCPAFWQLYVARTCTVWRNLRSSPELFRSVYNGTILGQELESMSAVELNFSHWRDELDAKSKRDASRFETRLVANTTEYTCKLCESKQCSSFEIQLRGSDEPATVFITCVECSYRWKDE